jgi:hypothetical protein
VPLGWREPIEPTRRLACRVEAPRLHFLDHRPSKLVQAPQEPVGFALAASGHLRWRSAERPRGAPRAPRGTTGRIAQEPPGLARLGRPQPLGPPGGAPLPALGLRERSGDAPGCLRRTAPLVESWRDRVGGEVTPKRRSLRSGSRGVCQPADVEPQACGRALLHSARCGRWVLGRVRGRPGGALSTTRVRPWRSHAWR